MKEQAEPEENPQMYTLTLSEKQMRVVADAVEFYTRFCIGQFDVPMVVQCRKPKGKTEMVMPDHDRRDHYLLGLRNLYFPDLHGLGHSYGVGWNEKPEQQVAQIGYEVYKWILYEFNKNSAFYNVHSSPPCLHYSGQPIPVVVKMEKEATTPSLH